MKPLALLLLLAVSSGATTQPATTQSLEQQLAEHKQQEKETFLAQLVTLPETKLATGKISDIFTMKLEAGRLVVDPKLSPTDGPTRCAVQGFTEPCSVTVFPGAVQFAYRDFGNEQEIFRHTMLFAHPGSVQLSMDLDGLVRCKSVSLIQDSEVDDPEMSVRLTAQLIDAVTDASLANYTLSAKTFEELRHKYPRETQEFVVPILRDLQQQALLAPDPQIAHQVLQTQPKPDDAAVKKLDAVLARLDSESFKEREQAAKDLAALGPSAAAVLARADRKGWSIDRTSAVDSFLKQYQILPAEQISALRKDPMFLLSCQYSAEEEIRTSAAKLLEASSHVSIDPHAAEPKRDEMIDQAFTRLFGPLPVKPATESSGENSTEAPATQP